MALIYEFITCTVYILAWIVIRRFPVKQKGIGNLVKPLLIAKAYTICLRFNMSFANGPLNGAIAVQLWWWGMAAYNDKVGTTEVTVFESRHYGRFIWIYVTANVTGGMLAGVIYRSWVEHFEQIHDGEIGEIHEKPAKDDKPIME